MKFVDLDDSTLTYPDDDQTKQAVFDCVIRYFRKLDMYSGESIGQSDEGYIQGVEMLCELADEVIKFEHEYKDEV